MFDSPLAQILVLLAASVFVVALARRVGLPAILGYVIVGLAFGPHALGLFAESATTQLLAELGVVFLLFTLGLEFHGRVWSRCAARYSDLAQCRWASRRGATALIAYFWGLPALQSIVVGGAIATTSTVLVVQQLTEPAELNRTHGRLAFSVVLFQDIAFVPFLALAAALAAGTAAFSLSNVATKVLVGSVAVLVVLAAGRCLLRPLFYEIAHSRLRELFTLAVLFVALASAWVSHLAGLSDGAWRVPRRHDARRNRVSASD